MELLQLLSSNRNDVDPMASISLAPDARSNERDLDAVDVQSDALSQVLRNPLPADLFDQVDPAFSEAEMGPETPADQEESNDPHTDLLRRMEAKQAPVDFAHLRLPPSVWGRVDADADRDDDRDLSRLTSIYDALLNQDRD